jgi:hypothetical protein
MLHCPPSVCVYVVSHTPCGAWVHQTQGASGITAAPASAAAADPVLAQEVERLRVENRQLQVRHVRWTLPHGDHARSY